MTETSASLLDALQDPADGVAWERLVSLYTPLLTRWLRPYAVQAQDCDDLVQEVMAVVHRRVGEFRRERTGSFRRWLKQVLVNYLRDHWKRQERRPRATGESDFALLLNQLADPHSQLSRQWDEEHDRHVTRFVLAQVRPDFASNTWEAFRRVALDGENAQQVADSLGVSVNAVHIAKSRVLGRVREVAKGLVE